MTKKFGYKNVMEVPKLEKIVINMGVGEAKENAKLLDAAIVIWNYHRTESSRTKSEKICCELQNQRGYADRMQSYFVAKKCMSSLIV